MLLGNVAFVTFEFFEPIVPLVAGVLVVFEFVTFFKVELFAPAVLFVTGFTGFTVFGGLSILLQVLLNWSTANPAKSVPSTYPTNPIIG